MIRKMSPIDPELINVQEKQKAYRDHIAEGARNLALENAFTYVEKDGIKAVFGMQMMWEGRAVVWALIGDVNNWVSLHKGLLKLISKHVKILSIRRLEMTTEVGFEESERWAEMLGFKHESLMSNFGVDGKDHKMWVRLWQQQSRGCQVVSVSLVP